MLILGPWRSTVAPVWPSPHPVWSSPPPPSGLVRPHTSSHLVQFAPPIWSGPAPPPFESGLPPPPVCVFLIPALGTTTTTNVKIWYLYLFTYIYIYTDIDSGYWYLIIYFRNNWSIARRYGFAVGTLRFSPSIFMWSNLEKQICQPRDPQRHVVSIDDIIQIG